jgi:hypothetical protein
MGLEEKPLVSRGLRGVQLDASPPVTPIRTGKYGIAWDIMGVNGLKGEFTVYGGITGSKAVFPPLIITSQG